MIQLDLCLSSLCEVLPLIPFLSSHIQIAVINNLKHINDHVSQQSRQIR
jgi:hypothetical protein